MDRRWVGALEPDPVPLVPVLVELLAEPAALSAAATALGEIGPGDGSCTGRRTLQARITSDSLTQKEQASRSTGLLLSCLLLVACESPPATRDRPASHERTPPLTDARGTESPRPRPALNVDRWVGSQFVEGMHISIDCENEALERVMVEIASRAGKEFYFSDPEALRESVSVTLKDIPWNEAAQVVGRMARKTVYTYPEGIFLDWACTSYPDQPSWSEVRRFAHPGLARGR